MATQSYIPALGYRGLTNLYDLAMATLFQEGLYRLPLITALDLQPGQYILDIGCGTGTLDLLLRRHAPDALVVGLDIDPAVLTIAQRKASRQTMPLALSRASATTLPFADNSFDYVVSSLMLHHLATAQKVWMIAEAHRVLRPGQSVAILDFGPPDHDWLATVLRTVAARFEHIDDNLYGRVPQLLKRAGFTNVQVRGIALAGLIKLYQGWKAVG